MKRPVGHFFDSLDAAADEGAAEGINKPAKKTVSFNRDLVNQLPRELRADAKAQGHRASWQILFSDAGCV